jgi:hypothetical protein
LASRDDDRSDGIGSNSPDSNPIENLWKLLKAEIQRAHPQLKRLDNSATMDCMIECAKGAWKALKNALLNKVARRRSVQMLLRMHADSVQNTELG